MDPRNLEDTTRFGALAATLFCLVGYAACLFLSVIKLRTGHNCSSFVEDVCGSRCSSTLRNPAAEILGLPITVYAAALYLVAAVLAHRAGRRPHDHTPRVPLLAIAWLVFGISVFYFAFAAFSLGTVCEYCGLLYFTSIGLLLGSSLLNDNRPFRAFLGPHGLRAGIAGALTALAVATVFVVHVNLYRRLVTAAEGQACETTEVLTLPDTSLRIPSTGSGEPVVIIAAFIDLACPHCRMSVEFWKHFQSTRSEAIELRFYHFPMDCHGPSSDSACDAAKVVECLGPQLQGRNLDLLDELLAMQDGPSPYFEETRLEAVAAKLGVAGVGACLRQSATVEAHVEFARSQGLHERPSALLIRMVDGKPTKAIPVKGSSKNKDFLDQKLRELVSSRDYR